MLRLKNGGHPFRHRRGIFHTHTHTPQSGQSPRRLRIWRMKETYQGNVPQLLRQRRQKLPLVRIISVRGLEAPLAHDNPAGTLALFDLWGGHDRRTLAVCLAELFRQQIHMTGAPTRRQVHFPANSDWPHLVKACPKLSRIRFGQAPPPPQRKGLAASPHSDRERFFSECRFGKNEIM